jgi:uncharacterized membrane protein
LLPLTFFRGTIEGISKYLVVFLLAAAPVSEVRGAIPAARIIFNDDTSFTLASVVAVLGNLVIAPILLTCLSYLEQVVLRYGKTLGRLYMSVLRRARKESEKVKRYGILGLAIFVAVPLPGTGAWTGSLVAYVLGFPRTKAIVAIEFGVVIASLIVHSAVALGIELLRTLFLL